MGAFEKGFFLLPCGDSGDALGPAGGMRCARPAVAMDVVTNDAGGDGGGVGAL